MPLPIEDYALIGDCQTAALVGRDGSIDWLCWPRFDSDACFAALLGTEEHGHWRIAPRDPEARVTRRYRPNTLILETRFECSDGIVTLVDFMPMGEINSSVVRLVVGERGSEAEVSGRRSAARRPTCCPTAVLSRASSRWGCSPAPTPAGS